MSRKCFSRRSAICDELRVEPPASSLRARIAVAVPARASSRLKGSGVRMPATTSSPCALGSHSPKKRRSPVEGSRVKATPVAESSPRLPKTIAWTLHAVPQLSGMPCILR